MKKIIYLIGFVIVTTTFTSCSASMRASLKPPKQNFKQTYKGGAPVTGKYCAHHKRNQWLNNRYVFNQGN